MHSIKYVMLQDGSKGILCLHVFVAAVLVHVLCMKRKNGFTGGCKFEFLCRDVA
jgi:hypothetical protein